MLLPHLERIKRKDERRQAILNQGIPVLVDETIFDEYKEKLREKQQNRIKGKRQSELEIFYQTHSTRHLLKLLRSSRTGYIWEPEIDGEYSLIEYDARYYALRRVLATRPHVMNKSEGERNRRKQASKQHGMGKSKNR